VQGALLRAALWNLEKALAAASAGRMADIRERCEQALELFSWLGYAPTGQLNQSVVEGVLELARKTGTDWFMHSMCLGLSKKRRGRPAEQRLLAVKALELKMAEGLTWERVAERLCPRCGPNEDPVGNIIQQVKTLKRVLRKHEITLTDR